MFHGLVFLGLVFFAHGIALSWTVRGKEEQNACSSLEELHVSRASELLGKCHHKSRWIGSPIRFLRVFALTQVSPSEPDSRTMPEPRPQRRPSVSKKPIVLEKCLLQYYLHCEIPLFCYEREDCHVPGAFDGLRQLTLMNALKNKNKQNSCRTRCFSADHGASC